MNKIKYEVVRDLLPVRTAIGSLSTDSKAKVEIALRTLETNPEPDDYGCERIEDQVFKIRVPVQDGEISVLYDLWRADRKVVLIEIKDVSWFREAKAWVGGLLDFGP